MKNRYLILLISLLYTIICIYFSPFVRGSDQYWYVEEVQSLTMHKAVTNNIYPASLPATNASLPRPWVQNRPVIYLVYLFFILFRNVVTSWVVFNCICTAIAGYILSKLVFNPDSPAFLWSFVLFLIFPLNFYLCLQPLPEIFNMLLIAIIIATIWNRKTSLVSTIIASVACGVLIWQRDNYLLLILLLPFFIVDRKERKSFLQLIPFFAITVIMLVSKAWLFPSHTVSNIGIADAILKVSPTGSNMINYFDTVHFHNNFSTASKIVLGKTFTNISYQLIPNGIPSIYFYLIDILLIPFIILVVKTGLKDRRVLILGMFILIHFATIALFQNQYRYASAALAPLFLGCYLYFVNAQIRINKFFKIAVPVGLFAFCVVIGRQNRLDAKADNSTVEKLRSYKNTIATAPVLVQFGAGSDIIYSYAYSPNLVYYFQNCSADQLTKLCERFNTNTVLVNCKSSTYKNIESLITYKEPLDPKNSRINNIYLVKLSSSLH